MTVVVLPTSPASNLVTPHPLDPGMILRPATGAGPQHFARGGKRFAFDVAYPPMRADTARPFISRIMAGQSRGVRLNFPLLGVNQSGGGAPLVRSAVTGGALLPLKGMTPGFVVREGFWLTVTNAALGQRTFHNVSGGDYTVDGSGNVDLVIDPALRIVLAVNDVILLDRPTIEGVVTSEVSWPMPTTRIVDLTFSIEEM